MHVTIRLNVHHVPDDEGSYYVEWGGEYDVLENTVPLDHRLGLAEAIAQSDKAQFDSISMVVDAVEKSVSKVDSALTLR